MKCRSLIVVVPFAFALFSLASCTQKVGSGGGDAPPPVTANAPSIDSPPMTAASIGADSKAKGIVIATIVTHDAKVSILSSRFGGGDPLRVVVRKNDGVLLADGVTIDELRATDPLVHAIVTSAVASNGGEYLDATLDHHPKIHGDLH